ncbi:PTS sugar transporter subunit IIB [Nocardioides mesophilus]|uniref:PTS sugar transporter subunit IIB n=1 Tax=Nocardioides mesophilus TaxID=433659 RepID=A0A7G9RE40_9ACTN|nr:PTS sugar transporter subunit IIB [Nocardioides mesophilus]QNN53865.1 PTS sugar transporter subunit IIB [Nocardioides mesophilus]
MAKQVLVICGTGVATSTVVATKIKEHCAAQGVDVDVRQGKVMDLLGGHASADLIVATTQVPADVTIPVIAGLPFLTGMGLDSTLDQIVAALRD